MSCLVPDKVVLQLIVSCRCIWTCQKIESCEFYWTVNQMTLGNLFQAPQMKSGRSKSGWSFELEVMLHLVCYLNGQNWVMNSNSSQVQWIVIWRKGRILGRDYSFCRARDEWRNGRAPLCHWHLARRICRIILCLSLFSYFPIVCVLCSLLFCISFSFFLYFVLLLLHYGVLIHLFYLLNDLLHPRRFLLLLACFCSFRL